MELPEIIMRPFLFSAIVGQAKLKTAYLANVINPGIGGLLVTGPKGTGKSTVVRSITSILPEYEAVDGCGFHCDPARPDRFCTLCRERPSIESVTRQMRIVSLPLSCTEDRLIGSIDIEALLKTREKKVQVGILGEANRNVLYVDEVNLLPDHLVDDILDAAASPWHTIEREGISITHPAEFILVGTMNPEEGELRPQILDRFPLCIKVRSVHDPRQRVEIVKRNLLYERNPEAFIEAFESEDAALTQIITGARAILPTVAMSEAFLYAIAEACAELKVDGQRPDIIIAKTAQTIAALDRRDRVTESDVLLSAELALCHRTRDGGLLEPPTEEEITASFTRSLGRRAASKPETGSRTTRLRDADDIDKGADGFLETPSETQEKTSTTLPEGGEKKT